MGRNIEIKARVTELDRLESKVMLLADSGPTDLQQDDTFFNCERGRLKLRQFSDSEGELIAYSRADTAEPKLSDYTLVPTTTPDNLRDALVRALGVIGRIRKHRRLYWIGQTRVHLDQVEHLGSFLELEVVLRDNDDAQAGVAIAQDLLSKLGVKNDDLIDVAYIDLLVQPAMGR